MFDGLADGYKAMSVLLYAACVALVIFVPLGLWKLIEILIWICRHVRWVS